MHSLSHRVRTSLLIAISLGFTASALAAQKAGTGGTFDRTLSVNGPVTLRVITSSGYIHVSPGSDNQVHVIGHVKADDSWSRGSGAGAIANLIATPPIHQTGNIILVGGGSHDDSLRHLSVDYEITTPQDTILTAKTGSGDVQLAGLKSPASALTGSGNIRADRLGAGSKLETGSGSIETAGLAGSSILHTGSGDIHAQFSAPGDVTAGTSSGSIRLVNVQGAAKVEIGAGNLDISGQPTSPWKLETGSGSMDLTVGNAHFTLDATTGAGSVKSDLPLTVQGSMDKRHLVGTINGGGPTVRAVTGSGNIHIH